MARRSGSNGEQTARDIRDAAMRLFADQGYAAVSMRQIARAVGVQAGALYLYTPDKQSLLSDMMIAHLEDLLAAWGKARCESDDPRARLEDFVRFHIRYHLSRVDEVFIAYMELRNLTPENFARVERLRRLYENVLQEILQDGAARGIFRLSDARIATLALIAMLTGITNWYRAGGRLSPERIEEIYIEMALGAVGAAR
ncbi:TetR/AcrR family transcriptional regulator [Halovulum dunhuangense]|uniref:TetR/AcrR family transcriptional regulator n=1 Tax=Halovulum dunhuangense TaxID=1505036 RepID=A0A849L461_9RHOB|nr:TetR/AcrR family transcriptional regulator [Halovulum dunhuangense]NNU81208.1 TetR/AcrR family transcriptional regulator [Halovulum dunhuangense]